MGTFFRIKQVKTNMNYYSLNNYLKDTFGQKIYKIAIDAGFTCPNRDGRVGTGGCIFCSAYGSGDFTFRNRPIDEQIEEGKKLLSKKVNPETGKYIAYFQSYTNTYAPVDELRQKFMTAINREDIVALSIATRPDCLPEEVLQLIKELNSIKPVWVELGLQTIKTETAKYIRRGYDLPVYDRAVENLKKIGIPQIITHIIIGLPGETKEDMLSTVKYVVNSGSNGIKLQLLHVLEGTDLATDYKNGQFEALSMEEYLDIIAAAVAIIPKDIVIHRLTGDGAKKDLIAPLWSGNKKYVINELAKRLS